ncbi:MAG TPA: AtpZ/AtpI family protein [Candidatus Baltobacteraceae bacterium]|nr:AtpZ/AtpI family protein [Candidatus Baltobacteraceae bacterium]
MSNSEDHRRLTAFALRIMGEIGGLIAVPAIVFTFLGRKLDLWFDAGPAFTVIALLSAFIISMAAVATKAAGYADRYDELTGDHERGPPPGDTPPG